VDKDEVIQIGRLSPRATL